MGRANSHNITEKENEQHTNNKNIFAKKAGKPVQASKTIPGVLDERLARGVLAERLEPKRVVEDWGSRATNEAEDPKAHFMTKRRFGFLMNGWSMRSMKR